jgi:hypothetical protein
MKALWRPAWYELDQSLAVGAVGTYAFCRARPSDVTTAIDLVFYNPLLGQVDPLFRSVRILRIHHPSLGPIARIDATGLTYSVVLMGGSVVEVEAEETPGQIESELPAGVAPFEDWDFEVELEYS